MEKIEFKSQICTTREQSERLLKLGIKKETADMMYVTKCATTLGRPIPEKYRSYSLILSSYSSPIDAYAIHIPAWSLHRLLMLKDKGGLIGTGVYINDMNVRECYEVVISRIADLLKNGAFDEDYLENALHK